MQNAHRPSGAGGTREYISDIDGLRALAVLAVTLFHLNIAGFAGGYVGVDIFFVISGFLISGIIRDAVSAGAFSFGAFYLRRIRRLLPAILATVAATTVAVCIFMLPQHIAGYARSALGAVFSFSNLVFFFEAGYWDSDSGQKPLLHAWSLSLEEQFYLFWPALTVLMMRTRQEHIYIAGLAALFLTSFVACVAYTPVNSAATFYLLPFRAWQFCLGALGLEFCRAFVISDRSRHVYRWTGLALCIASIVGLKDASAFPGWIAMAPSVGAALVLISSASDKPTRVLSNAPALWFGRISYSLYLAHWPPIAIYRASTGRELDVGAQLWIGALIILLGAALHYGIERRFYRRDQKSGAGLGRLYAGMATATIVITMAAGGAWLRPGAFALRETPLSAEQIAEYRASRWRGKAGVCQLVDLETGEDCRAAKDRPILIIGNSKEVDAANFLGVALPEEWRDKRVLFGEINSCRGKYSVVGDWIKSRDANCQRRFDALRNSLKEVDYAAIVYSAHEPFKTSKRNLMVALQTVHRERPETPIVILGDFIGTHKFCGDLINTFGSSDACKAAENVYYFEDRPEKEPLYKWYMAMGDLYIDQVALLCQGRKLESCIVETPDGVPAFVDKTHFTYPFSQMAAQKYVEQNPDWFSELLENKQRRGNTKRRRAKPVENAPPPE